MNTIEKYEHFGRCLGRCESPIERMFLAGLLILMDNTFEPADGAPIIARDKSCIELGQQFSVGDYRIDFTLSHPSSDTRFAIEVDGYVHHGSTPDQFAHDAARQRVITANGWTVLRFSGKEIVRNTRHCAQEAMSVVVASLPTVPEAGAKPKRSLDPTIERIRAAELAGDMDEAIRLMRLVEDAVRKRNKLAARGAAE